MKTIDEIRRDNLQIAVKRLRTASALAERAGVAAAYLSQIKNKTPESKTGKPKTMGDDVARKIEEAIGEQAGWMDMDHTSASAESPNNGGKPALSRDSQTFSGNSIDATMKFDKNVAPARLGPRQIPVISYVQAGMMTEAVDPFSLGFGLETIQPTVECSEYSFALKIDGDSMEPRFHEGDVVIIDPGREPRPGSFVVAKNGKDEATFKKYRPRGTDERGNVVFELVPLNEDYPTLHSERDHLRIIGVCVERREVMQ